MTELPAQGQTLPEVDFIDESGGRRSSSDLTGEKTVLYFYRPCTKILPR